MGGIISLSTSNSSPSFVSLPNGSIEKVSSRGISQQTPSSITLPKNSLSDLIQKDTHVIRCKILNDIPLSFLHPTIILLYGPPLSYCDELGYFIASKCQMTLFNARDFVTFEEMYHELSRRIQKDDCQIGFILVNFPKSISEGEKFNNRTRRFKKVVLLLEQDFTRLLRAKCADWIHVPSGRRYHTTNNPPKSMKGTLDDVRNMYDDETAEPLQPIVDRKEYRAELKDYSKMSTTMRTFYAHSLSTIKGDQSVEDLKQEVVFTLCRVIANQPKLRGRSSSHFTTTQTEDQECPLITIEKMPKSVLPIDEKSASVVPPLQLSSLPTDPKLELVRTPNSEIVLKPNLVSPSDVAEIRVPPPSNPASSNSFPTLTSLKHSLLEKHISKTHEEKSETLFAKFRRLSISSKREVLDEKDPHEEQVERQASDIFYSKNEIITPHYQVVENRQRQKTEFEYCDDDTIPVKTARGSHHPSTMV